MHAFAGPPERFHAKPGVEQDMSEAPGEVRAARDIDDQVAAKLRNMQTRVARVWQGHREQPSPPVGSTQRKGMTRAISACRRNFLRVYDACAGRRMRR